MTCWTSILRGTHLWQCNVNEICYQAELSSLPFICTRYSQNRIQKNFIEQTERLKFIRYNKLTYERQKLQGPLEDLLLCI